MYKIALDAGHGLHTPGRRCLKQFDPSETREWQLNSRIAEKVTRLLNDYPAIQINRMDDPTGRVDVPLSDRVNKANSWKADLYLSIHHNAGGGTGIVSFCYGAGSPASFLFRDLAYEHLIHTTGNRGNRAEPLAVANFYVNKYTNMPSVLLELGFMDHPNDILQIITDGYADKCAEGIVSAVLEMFHIPPIRQHAKKVGWYEEDGGWRFYPKNTNTYIRNTWHQDSGSWYWFDGSGLAIHDTWYQDNGKWYYFASDCHMVQGQWILYQNHPYYLTSSGAMYYGTAKTNADGAFMID